MAELDHLWAGWRTEYVESTTSPAKGGCVFCALLKSGLPDSETYIVQRSELAFTVLNSFPYGTGHVLVMPTRHVGDLGELTEEESGAVWQTIREAVQTLKAVYNPEGTNVGFNLGRAAGAGLPEHLHAHALPRWNGDTNFMTSVANARVLNEALEVTWGKLQSAWPGC